jgi:hypothetical protein
MEKEIKTDYLGNEIGIGTEVVFMQLGYRELMKGVIIKMSGKQSTMRHEETNTGRTISRQFNSQLIKVIK